MNIVAAALLAQLAGGAMLLPPAPLPPVTVEVAALPTCGPRLLVGTPCIWHALPHQVFSTSRPGKFIWVALIVEQPYPSPWPFPGAEPPVVFVRHTKFNFAIDFYPQGSDPSQCREHEEYRLNEQYGGACPE